MKNKALYIDCSYGIAGDMLLSSLIDLGVDIKQIVKQLNHVVNFNFKLSTQTVNQQGINCKRLILDFDNNDQLKGHMHNHYMHIKDMIIKNDALNKNTKDMCLRVFKTLAAAESTIHGIPIDEVAFHEVGATDSIIDIVGNCIAIDSLNVDAIIFSSVPIGYGKINIQHGLYPIPAPATLEILKDVPISDFSAKGELTTPTGAAIAKTLATDFANSFSGTVHKVGYGCGTKSFAHPNILRTIFLNDTNDKNTEKKTILVCQVDDMTGEELGFFMEKALEKGALDIYYTPIYMKKNRPAIQISLICDVKETKRFEAFMLKNTSTFGIRKHVSERKIIDRKHETIEIKGEKLQVKCGFLDNKLIKVTPEYESVKKLANIFHIDFMKMYRKSMTEINKFYFN
jgi:uncharacterized protein (TIGR00299 family) protein